jgi:hypothetical protein
MAKKNRRLREGENPNRGILLAWLTVSVLLLLFAAPNILDNRLPRSDDALRLAQVRDLMAGQGWYDLHQYRMTPPGGTLMPLSRLLDAPIAAMIWALSLFMEQPLAERVAMVLAPLFALLLTMLAIGRLTWRLFDRQTAILACLTLPLLPLMALHFQPMRIDDIGWQLSFVALAVWAMSWRNALRGGSASGLAMAFSLMISFDSTFPAAVLGAIFALRWLRDHHARWWLVSYLQSLALGLFVLFALTRGLPDIAPHCDVISPPHLGFCLIVALGAGMLAVAPPMPRIPLLLTLGGFGLLGLGFIAWSAPQCLGAPSIEFDPVRRRGIAELIPALSQPVFALAVAFHLALRSRDWLRTWWFEYTLLVATAVLASVMFYPLAGLAALLSALPIGWFLVRLFKRWRAYENPMPKLALIAVVYLLFAPASPVLLAQKLSGKSSHANGAVADDASCHLQADAGLLNRLQPAIIWAPPEMGAMLLARTHHSIVASNQPRSGQPKRDVVRAFASSPEVARGYVDTYGARYLVLCSDPEGAQPVAAGSSSLEGSLLAGEVPAWLEPIDIGGSAKIKVWRVISG